MASGAITIEDVENNYKVPAETPCSEESDGAARKSRREKNFLFRRRNEPKLWQLLHQSQLNRQPRKKNKSQFNSQRFKMMSDSSAANGNAAKSEDSIQQSLRATDLIRRETFTMMRLVYFFKLF
jgi:hypothetical protein